MQARPRRTVPSRSSRSRRVATVLAAVLGGCAALLAPVASASAGNDNGAPGGRPDVITLPDGFNTEGVTSAPDGTFYATSLTGRGIRTGSLRDGSTERFVRLPGTSLRGAVIDRRSGFVWTVGSRGQRGILLVLDPAASDPVLEEVTLQRAGFPNDLTFSGGRAWITDSARDHLYRVEVATDGRPARVSTLPLSGGWQPVEDDPAGTIAANGIRRLPDRTLVVVDSRDGGLFSVLRRDGEAREIPVRGRRDLRSGDGLVLRGRTLYVVRGPTDSAIEELRLAGPGNGWRAAYRRTLRDRDLSVPSTATYDRGALWAVNAEFGTGDDSFEVVRVDLR